VQSEVSSGGAVDGVAHVVKFIGIWLRWGFSPPLLFSHLTTKSMLGQPKIKVGIPFISSFNCGPHYFY